MWRQMLQFWGMITEKRGGIMRINKELALDCPMAAQIMNSSSKKKKELIIRLAERQLMALGYNQQQFRNSEDIRLVIDMMNRGFISGCTVTERKRKMGRGIGIRREHAGEDTKRGDSTKEDIFGGAGDPAEMKEADDNTIGGATEIKDFRNDYLGAVRSVLGDDEFGSMAEGDE